MSWLERTQNVWMSIDYSLSTEYHLYQLNIISIIFFLSKNVTFKKILVVSDQVYITV